MRSNTRTISLVKSRMRESRTSGISVRGGGSNPPVYSTLYKDARRDEVTVLASVERKTLRNTAKRMKADGMDTTIITKYTGLTAKEISDL